MHPSIRIAVALALSAPLAAQPAAAPSAKAWPREVQAVYDGFKSQCIEAGGKFVPDHEFFATETEVTGDGKPDWIIDYGAWQCKVSQAQMDAGNYPETGSGYCGSAGCQLTILGSTRKGLVPIFEGNLRDWKAVDLGGGRRGIETSVHGSACGGYGAEACIETLAWNGSKWLLVKRYRWTDADYAANQRRQAALPPYQEPPRHEAKWVFGGQGANAVAAVVDHPELGTLGLRCQPGGGIYLTIVPPPGQGKLRPLADRPLLLSFEGSMEGIMADLALTHEAGKPDWSGPLTPPLEALLGGRDDGLTVLASADGGAEWQELAYFSLAGSTAAVRALKAQCPAGQAVASNTTAARIPLAVGYYAYVEGTFSTCAQPVGDPWYFDGTRFWERTDITDPKHEYTPQALKWEMVATDRFRIAYRSRDEDGRWDANRSVNEYVITSPQSFTFVGVVGGPLRSNEKHQLCAPSQLPAKARWYKGPK